jgi:hypothetical protein
MLSVRQSQICVLRIHRLLYLTPDDQTSNAAFEDPQIAKRLMAIETAKEEGYDPGRFVDAVVLDRGAINR